MRLPWPHLAVLASLTTLATCAPTPADDREHLSGFATEQCIDAIEGLSHGAHDPSLDVLLTHDGDALTFERMSTFACPIHAEDDGDTIHVPAQDCADGLHEERDLHGTGTRDGDTIILELESTEMRPSEDDPTAPTHPISCTHHYELVPTD